MLTIEEPFHGAVLNYRHGRGADGGLAIRVSGTAPLRGVVRVNGAIAERAGGRFWADVVLRERVTEIVATSDGSHGHFEQRIRVLWDRHSFPRYRFSIDDNSFFLRDIAQQGYRSLFDCFYLRGLRELHERYGTRFVLNIYYTTGDGFTLAQFPDRYRGEWRDNADWLRLAFHAYANEPDRPYQYAPVEKLLADFDLVAEEIRRFAGEETYSPPTVIHWGMVMPSALAPLAERGVRALSGFLWRTDGLWDIHYWLDDERCDYLARHDALADFESGIVFSRADLVCNAVPLEQIEPTLAPLAEDPNQAEVMDLFTHEQYFWPFYANYIPEHFQRLETAIRWVTERGYRPVFLHEGLLGSPA